MNELLSKISRGKNQLYGKYVIPLIEKQYSFDDGREQMHYLYYKKKSPVLIIGFQAFNAKGARYSYVTPLSSVKASRLYIKDDFVPGCGNYYLGRNNRYNIEEEVYHLIDRTLEETGAVRPIFIGSSKGGYAAVNFGIHYKNSVMIAGSPQYLLGTYMHETKKFNKGLEDIVSMPVTDEKIKQLDDRLRDKIRNDPYADTQTAYIQYSEKEDGHKEHMVSMIEDMKKAGLNVHCDRQMFTEHSDLKHYFPEYLKTNLINEIRSCQ